MSAEATQKPTSLNVLGAPFSNVARLCLDSLAKGCLDDCTRVTDAKKTSCGEHRSKMTPIPPPLFVLDLMAGKTLEDCAQLLSAGDASSEEKNTRHAPGVSHPRLLLDRLTRHHHFPFLRPRVHPLLRQKIDVSSTFSRAEPSHLTS